MTDSRGWGEAPEELTDVEELPPSEPEPVIAEKGGEYAEVIIPESNPEHALVKFDLPFKVAQERGLNLLDLFRNVVCEADIDYSRFSQVGLVCAIDGLAILTGSLRNPKKMDRGRRERAWRQVDLRPLAKK